MRSLKRHFLTIAFLLVFFLFGQENTIEKEDSLQLDTLSLEHDTTLANKALAEYRDAQEYEPVNLSELNSSVGDFAPYISLSGERLYFSSSREGGLGGDDIWYSLIGPHKYSKPMNLGAPINSKYNEGSISFSPDGRFAYFTVCGRPDSYGGCDIYRSEFKDGEWQRPRNLGKNVNSPKWDGHPYVSADGIWLYFSSERYGGFGSRDLYRAPLTEEGIGKAQNLGFPVNNARDQVSPALHPDGKTLYFASSGHGGSGGLDVFKSVMNDMGNWSEPMNLRPPVNTSGNDYFFAIPTEGDIIYFASSRLGGYGGTDIYTYPLDAELRPSVVATLHGSVIDQTTGEPIEANVRVEDIADGEVLYDRMTDPETGEFIVVLPAGRNYGISVSADDYLFSSQNYEVEAKEGYQDLDQTFELSRIETGASVNLNNLFFFFGKADLKPESFPELDRVVEVMNKYPDMEIEIRGYTDTIGTAEFNQWLSDERAKAVAEYLKEKGIEAGRISSKGFGEMHADKFSLARRVEFHILNVSGVKPRPKQEKKPIEKDESEKEPGKSEKLKEEQSDAESENTEIESSDTTDIQAKPPTRPRQRTHPAERRKPRPKEPEIPEMPDSLKIPDAIDSTDSIDIDSLSR